MESVRHFEVTPCGHGTVASTHLSIPGFHLSGIPKIQNIRGLLTGYVLGGGFNPVEIY